MSARRLIYLSCVLFLLRGAAPAAPQSPASPLTSAPAAADANTTNAVLADSINALAPRIDQLHQALVATNVSKWKAPGGVRATAQSDLDSMQRDVSGTLPSLLEKAKGTTGEVGPAFALFRNVDALYDVLLRVSETATMAGAQQDSRRLEEARVTLEEGRSQLGNALLQSSTNQDAEVAQLRAGARAAQEAAAAKPAAKTVVDDGPPAATKKPRRKKSTPAPAAPPQ